MTHRVALFILTLLGHVSLLTVSLNLFFRATLREALWLLTCAVHGVLLIGIPFLLASAFFGRHRVPAPAMAYAAACWAALGFVVVFVIHRRVTSTPRLQRTIHVESHDLTPPPLPERGIRPMLARLPFNGLHRLSLVELQLELPTLPAEWDGMSILHLTDLHFQGTPRLGFFQRAMELAAERWKPDLIALTGDVIDNPRLLDWIPAALSPLRAPLGQFFLLGNHDVFHNHDQPTREAMRKLGWTDISQRHEMLSHKARPLLIAGTEHPWIGTHPEVPETPGVFRLLLAHSPHTIGWARQNQFDLLLAGHLHGGQIALPLVGPVLGGRYAAGVFHRPPTVMHVSRGVGGLTPLRILCPPDVTLLTLHRAG